jgi:hypothetical protein
MVLYMTNATEISRNTINTISARVGALPHINTIHEADLFNLPADTAAVFALFNEAFDTSREGWLIIFRNGDVAFINRAGNGSIDIQAVKAARTVTRGGLRHQRPDGSFTQARRA